MAAHTRIGVGAVALAGAGAVTVWAAHRGVGVAGGLRTILSGRTLPAGEDLTVTAAAGTAGTAGSGIGANNPVAAAATAYVDRRHVYRWGGGSPRGWDCSGFVDWVLCHDLGYAIPGYAGGAFDGSSHGPVTMQWAVWSGCVTIARAEVEAGDLVVWPTQHMGIAVDNQRMCNAPGPNGTPAPIISRIDGAALGPLVCRRLLGRR